jgi:hypothetical protein
LRARWGAGVTYESACILKPHCSMPVSMASIGWAVQRSTGPDHARSPSVRVPGCSTPWSHLVPAVVLPLARASSTTRRRTRSCNSRPRWAATRSARCWCELPSREQPPIAPLTR